MNVRSSVELWVQKKLLQRRIDRESAEDLFQELWLHVLEDRRVESLAESNQLSSYLYRAARERLVAFHHGGLAWIGGHRPSATGLWRPDEPSPLEERLGHRQLARCARELLFRAPISPDRKILERLFLRPAPDPEAPRTLDLTDIELGQILWRARQLFAATIREHGVNPSDAEIRHAKDVQRAAMYVAGALSSKMEVRAFELKMMLSPRCATEVDVWRALKRGMVHVERRRESEIYG